MISRDPPPFPHSKVQVLGCGGHARSLADILLKIRPDLEIQFYDLKPQTGETLFGFPISPIPTFLKGPCIAALGDAQARQKMMESYPDADWISVIAPNAHIGKGARIEPGTFIGSGAHLGPNVTIGKGSILNTHAVVDHDTSMGAYCHAAPNATVCGGCFIEDHVFLGAGSIVIENMRIASHSTIGAGATVIEAIETAGLYVGVPARWVS